MDGIPKLSDGAITNSTDSFLPYMHGSEKRDYKLETPLEVMQEAIQEAIHKVLRERLDTPFETVKIRIEVE